MDTSEVKARKLKLRDDMFKLIQDFVDETGCWPVIYIDKMEVEQFGKEAKAFANIRITAEL